MERFQKLALAALVSVLLLLFVGAIVRASGSGLGCPDWPTCWGKLIPPTSAEQIDFDKIDLEKFQRKAARYGRDPDSMTLESLRGEFNPVHTWVEYVNRLCSMPVGIFTLILMVAAFRIKGECGHVRWMSLLAFVLVLVNAELGRRVVLSGLKPGVITLHMALAILLLCILVYVFWRGCRVPVKRSLHGDWSQKAWFLGLGVFILTVVEGVMGAQVRELTDELARDTESGERSSWIGTLEESGVYLVHRSFSWLIVLGTVGLLVLARRSLPHGCSWLDKTIAGLVGSLLIMGVLLARVGVLPVVQVLHVGAAALLITLLFYWLLVTRAEGI